MRWNNRKNLTFVLCPNSRYEFSEKNQSKKLGVAFRKVDLIDEIRDYLSHDPMYSEQASCEIIKILTFVFFSFHQQEIINVQSTTSTF